MAMTAIRSAAALVAGGILALTGCTAIISVGSAGSCVAPEATTAPTSASPGETITLRGKYFMPCNDTNMASDPPFGDLDIQWVQGDAVSALGTVHPEGTIGELAVDVTVPADATGGSAVVRIMMPTLYGTVDVPVTVAE
ncbi:hypothetical protein [Microbacterium elymi]|uniref:Uncharacterized protein n=1 Tax=Microbacterium elymi TaxID=2909587 RepID=A0ABY5NM91_9MICO|nr:hypothetical protein [Microbacterium elymi]UUT36292.1 hypothetical protein L2X98_25330 [Microbacterium elymi]